MNPALSAALDRLINKTMIASVSDTGLVRSIRRELPSRVSITRCEALDEPQRVVPLEALRGLAVASAVSSSADLLQVQANWAVARYVGSFEHHEDRLVLSPPGEAVAGNQRRVLSEELGIAFALQAALKWLALRSDPASPVWVADIDQLPLSSHPAKSRPDYVIAARALGVDDVLVTLLESKGTRTPSYAERSLTSGCRQIAPTVEALNLPGLVVSTVTGATIRSAAAEVGGDRWRTLPSSDPLVIAVQQASLESLAETAGNAEAADGWRAEREQRSGVRLPTRPRVNRTRTQQSTTLGGPAIGLQQQYRFPGGELDVFLGVVSEIDDHLVRPREEVVAAQSRVRARRTEENADVVSDRSSTAVGPDGSVATVRLQS